MSKEYVETRSITARDDRTLAVYQAVWQSRGLTTAEIARIVGVSAETVLIDLHHLARGELVCKIGHRWHWSKINAEQRSNEAAILANVSRYDRRRKANTAGGRF